MAKRFDELSALAALADDDLFVVDDTSGSETKYVVASKIVDYIEASGLSGIALNSGDALTATSTEINTGCAGLTITAAELNRMDGHLPSIVADADEAVVAQASVTFTGLAAGKRYRLEFEIDHVLGSSADLSIRFGNSGGIDSGSNYAHLTVKEGASAATRTQSSSATAIRINPAEFDNQIAHVGFVDFSIVASDDTRAQVIGMMAGQSSAFWEFTGAYNGASTIDRIQLVGITATFSGRVRLIQTN